MNPEFYFECHPHQWLRDNIRRQTVGPTTAVAIQQTCPPDAPLDQTCRTWRAWLEDLFGPPETTEQTDCDLSTSLLLRYPGPIIVRIFLDRAPGPELCNLEIVGRDGLIVWKPGSTPLSVIHHNGAAEVCCQHPYADSLTKEYTP